MWNSKERQSVFECTLPALQTLQVYYSFVFVTLNDKTFSIQYDFLVIVVRMTDLYFHSKYAHRSHRHYTPHRH